LKHSFDFATTISAMGNDDVAAGLGAFRTCKIRFLSSPVSTVSKTKSSTRFPSADKACARTPLGPLNTNNETFIFQKYSLQSLPFNIVHSQSRYKFLQFFDSRFQRISTAHFTNTISHMFPCQFTKATKMKTNRSKRLLLKCSI
jgi:hypothetical protein